MKSVRLAIASFAITASAISYADHASAAVIFSQDFKSGLSSKEKIVSYGAKSSFGAQNGFLGHSASYLNFEDSLYILDMDFTKFKNVLLSFDLISKVEDNYDIFRAVFGNYDGSGRFQDAYTTISFLKDESKSVGVAVPDGSSAKLLAFRFTSDRSNTDAGVQVRNLRITGDAIGGTDVPVGAVPEPATWAMMITGFAAIGGMLRGRAKRGDRRASLV